MGRGVGGRRNCLYRRMPDNKCRMIELESPFAIPSVITNVSIHHQWKLRPLSKTCWELIVLGYHTTTYSKL